MTDNKTKKELVEKAVEARKYSYSPYSGYRVGAAVLTADGNVYTGCNVESASYPCGICAERTAVSKAVSEGKRDFGMIAIAGSSEEKCTPCGLCRQFLYEFSPEMTVLCSDCNGDYTEITLSELLPLGFGAESMK